MAAAVVRVAELEVVVAGEDRPVDLQFLVLMRVPRSNACEITRVLRCFRRQLIFVYIVDVCQMLLMLFNNIHSLIEIGA